VLVFVVRGGGVYVVVIAVVIVVVIDVGGDATAAIGADVGVDCDCCDGVGVVPDVADGVVGGGAGVDVGVVGVVVDGVSGVVVDDGDVGGIDGTYGVVVYDVGVVVLTSVDTWYCYCCLWCCRW